MEDDLDVEEGEAVSSINEDIDPDTDLSYIDEKLQHVLGPYQKDFEGCAISANELGPKFGAYGSFLPSYECSLEVAPCQKTSETKQSVQRCYNSMPLKDRIQDFQHLKNPVQSVRLGSASHQTSSSCNIRVPTAGASITPISSFLSAEASGKQSLKEGHLSTSSSNITDKKTLKIRFKLGTEYLSKPSSIYRDLGLKNSPSLSSGDSQDECSGVLPPISQEATSDSPSMILREMTRFPVPGGLISPLHASLLNLTRQETENKLEDNQAVLTASEFPSAASENELLILGNGKILNEKRIVKSMKKSDSSKQKKQIINSCSIEKTSIGDRMNSGKCSTNQTSTSRKEFQSSEDKKKPKSMSKSEKIKDTLTRGFGGQSAGCSVSTSKHKLKIGASNLRENQLDHPHANSDISEFSGGKYSDMYNSERKHKGSVNKSREKCSANKSCEEAIVIPPSEDGSHSGQHNVENGLSSQVVHLLPIVELDNWVQCDRCENWRLLPPIVAHDKLPKKWVCSMQSWLPRMNHCIISQDETEKTVRALFQIPRTVAHNQPESGENKPVSDVRHLELSTQKKTSKLVTLSKGGRQALDQSSSCTKSNLCKSLRGKSMKQPLPKYSVEKSGSYSQVASCVSDQKYAPEQKEKPIIGGVGVVKQTKTERTRMSNQTRPGCGSHGTKSYEEMNGRLKKRKLIDTKENHEKSDQELLSRRDNLEIQHEERSAETSRIDSKELITRESNDRSSKSSIAKQSLHSGIEVHHSDGYECKRKFDSAQKDIPYGQGYGAATSSSLKVRGSRKSEAANQEKLKASPVESVSSSRLRISYPEKCAAAKNKMLRKDGFPNGDAFQNKNSTIRRIQDPEGAGEFGPKTDPRIKKEPKAEEYGQSQKLSDLSCPNGKALLQQNQLQGCSSPGHDSAAKGAETKKFSTSIRKEAEKVRDDADNFKSSDFKFEYKETSFKAALRLLYGASLIEASHDENPRHGETNHMEEYRSAARLFENCAHEYETQKEMAAAALSYKCMTVAYMRMVYCKSLSTMSDWDEWQTTLQMILTGESPSSSVSDVDNINHQGTMDRVVLTKGALPHIAGNRTIDSLNHSKFTLLLDFTENANLAMESSRKSQTAFETATVALEAVQNRDCITSMKRALNFDFHNIEAFISLVEAAMDTVSHLGPSSP